MRDYISLIEALSTAAESETMPEAAPAAAPRKMEQKLVESFNVWQDDKGFGATGKWFYSVAENGRIVKTGDAPDREAALSIATSLNRNIEDDGDDNPWRTPHAKPFAREEKTSEAEPITEAVDEFSVAALKPRIKAATGSDFNPWGIEFEIAGVDDSTPVAPPPEPRGIAEPVFSPAQLGGRGLPITEAAPEVATDSSLAEVLITPNAALNEDCDIANTMAALAGIGAKAKPISMDNETASVANELAILSGVRK